MSLWSYFYSDVTKLLFFFPNELYISIYIFNTNKVFFSTQRQNFLIKIIKRHRLGYVKSRNFRLPIFSYKLLFGKEKNVSFFHACKKLFLNKNVLQ